MFKNILANIVGRFWSVFSNYLFIPIYIKLLGLENYSVISFSLVILGIISILDSGLTATLSKEFASKQKTAKEKLKLLATLEFFYLILLLFLISLFLLFSSQLASKWLNLSELNPHDVSLYLKVLGIGLSFQLISNFYMGGLIGLEHQISANKYQITYGIFKNGLVLVVIFFNPSLFYFFLWQTIVTICYVIFIRYKLQSYIAGRKYFSFKIQFDKTVFLSVWKFAAGMLIISIVASINTQLDKLVISRLLNISELGVYNIAGSMAQALFVLVTPISVALLPRFTALYSDNNSVEASRLFHIILKAITILIFTVSATLIFNSSEIIWAWTGNIEIAKKASVFMPYMVFGTSLLVLMMLPFDIAIANGYTRLNNIIGILSICFTIPAYIYMVNQYGPLGAAISWCTLQIIISPIYFHLINKRFINVKSTPNLIFKDILFPLAITFVTAFCLTYINLGQSSRLLVVIGIIFNTLITLIVAMLLLVSKNEVFSIRMQLEKYINFKKHI